MLMPLTKRGEARCGRRKYCDTEYCFWHSPVEGKTNSQNIEAYFGQGTTLVRTLEAEVKAGNSLENVILPNVNLGGNYVKPGPNLSNALLQGANLNKASLSYCDLSGASLARANLVSAKLSDCRLADANFTRARMF
ncbi:MAG: pentapeptide repeat-containing protein, partial [Hyphomicrobium sp.]|nr:pentapeptide repeat-containing protein [Hyphomicrobium sp.]